jgi:hypothetical protein
MAYKLHTVMLILLHAASERGKYIIPPIHIIFVLAKSIMDRRE